VVFFGGLGALAAGLAAAKRILSSSIALATLSVLPEKSKSLPTPAVPKVSSLNASPLSSRPSNVSSKSRLHGSTDGHILECEELTRRRLERLDLIDLQRDLSAVQSLAHYCDGLDLDQNQRKTFVSVCGLGDT
jgi:hypothetical protein